jgi:hypothetical protein
MVKAKIKTKSNYRNLNGTWLVVAEMVGTRVSCIVEIDGVNKTVDFGLTEITEFNYKLN